MHLSLGHMTFLPRKFHLPKFSPNWTWSAGRTHVRLCPKFLVVYKRWRLFVFVCFETHVEKSVANKKRCQFGRRKALTISDDDEQPLTRRLSEKSTKTKCLVKFWHNVMRHTDGVRSHQRYVKNVKSFPSLKAALISVFVALSQTPVFTLRVFLRLLIIWIFACLNRVAKMCKYCFFYKKNRQIFTNLLVVFVQFLFFVTFMKFLVFQH